MRILMDFSHSDDVGQWSPLNDVVMGGRSSSQVRDDEDFLRFEGYVSLENGGGFASIQADVEFDLSGATELILEVRGDGRRYHFGLYDERGRRRIAYRVPFETVPETWTQVRVGFDELRPRFRGRDVPEAAPLNRANVRGLSILISDQQAGPFALDIRSISVVD